MIVSVCLSSNLYYCLLRFFFLTVYLFAGLLLTRFAFCACLVYLCARVYRCVCLCSHVFGLVIFYLIIVCYLVLLFGISILFDVIFI